MSILTKLRRWWTQPALDAAAEQDRFIERSREHWERKRRKKDDELNVLADKIVERLRRTAGVDSPEGKSKWAP